MEINFTQAAVEKGYSDPDRKPATCHINCPLTI